MRTKDSELVQRIKSYIEDQCEQKSQCKKKVQFPNEASLERFICGLVLEYNRESEERIHKGFALAQPQLTDLFS